MASVLSSPSHRFHETPLVFFSALGAAGAGIGVANLLQGLLDGVLPVVSRSEAILLTLLLGAGTAISAGHLGRPLRGPLALRRVGRSPLSNEILALGVALLGGGLSLSLPLGFPLRWGVDLLVCLGSLAFLLALGAVYDIPGQLAWRGLGALQPLAAATAWGLLLLSYLSPQSMSGRGIPVFLAVVLVDGILASLRAASAWRGTRLGLPVFQAIFRWFGVLVGTRLFLSAVCTPLVLLAGQDGVALFTFSLALLVDRFGFYGLAVRGTTESEVARVEALL